MEPEFVTYLSTLLGTIAIKGTEHFITSVHFVMEEENHSNNIPETVLQGKLELEEYFAGKRKQFTVRTKPEGTEFQKLVWAQLKQIPYGTTSTYGSIAKAIQKDERSSRAVGHANGQNPIAIIIPCHRVIGENGKLTGYAGGLWRKEWLLKHEGEIAGTRLRLFS